MIRLTFLGRLTANVICLWCYASWLIQWLLWPDKSSSNNIQIEISKINQGNPTLSCLFCQDKSNSIYSDLERSTSIFDLRSMSKGDLTRSYCISFDASIQEEHCKTYPRGPFHQTYQLQIWSSLPWKRGKQLQIRRYSVSQNGGLADEAHVT